MLEVKYFVTQIHFLSNENQMLIQAKSISFQSREKNS